MMRAWNAIKCMFSRDCDLFQGDDFTAWLKEQREASERQRAHQQERLETIRRSVRGPIDDAMFPDSRRREDRS